MEKLKFTLFSIVVLGLFGLFGYWAVMSLQSGSEYKASEKLDELKKENEALTKEVEILTNKLNTLEPKTDAVVEDTVETTKPAVSTPPKTTTYKNQSLIDELQKLVDDGVTMKLKSIGTRVGTVQKFLNLYNKTSSKIDNDYGPTMVKLVTAFQKDQGLTANGEAGPSTFKKMIDWLKKQG